MRKIWCVLLCLCVLAGQGRAQTKNVNPLAAYSEEWNDPRYKDCNTASKAAYLSAEEKQLVWVLNMARLNPALFCKTVVAPYSKKNGIDMESETYYLSLMRTMRYLAPLGILKPDQECFQSAECHAVSSGRKGYTGHNRQSRECRQLQKYNGECCSYGVEDPVGIIVTLLVDEDVPSLGHRNILLGAYLKTGVAIRPHKGYGINAVLDFVR